ncbi:MAG TPA: MBL fold metallo-hydrolase [Gemmatimonadales bacterium]|nr:MBL fold metallo-hydrolase [Gemmatimonadales bacterium]
MSVSVTFWGTRGTIPTPGPQTARYGGNTACVEVTDSRGNLVILDAGTGIRSLGRKLAGNGELSADIFLSHAHWDHIQGLPYFAPLFRKGNHIRVWGPKQGDVEMETVLRQLMQPVTFPVPLDALAAKLEIEHVNDEPVKTPGFAVGSMRVRHPAVTVGYKLRWQPDRTLVYVTDNELGPAGKYDVGPNWRAEFLEFIGECELLVHDAMYTPEELPSHAGWGHSTYEEAVQLAHEAGARRLALFHHEPEHGDREMDRVVDRARQYATKLGGRLEVFAASEGMTLEI